MSLCPLFSSIFLSHFLSLSPTSGHYISLPEESITDTVFGSLSTPIKRSFESGMASTTTKMSIIVFFTVRNPVTSTAYKLIRSCQVNLSSKGRAEGRMLGTH